MAFKLRIMRRIYLFILLLCAFMFAAADGALAAYYDEGHTGDSWEDAYIIDTVDDFKLMRDKVYAGTEGNYSHSRKYYKLSADLDLTSETDWRAIGHVYDDYFSGYFDGQNHTIKVNINRENVMNVDASLFNKLVGTIKNLKVSGTIKNIKNSAAADGHSAGGITVRVEGGTLENCHFSGTVEGYHAGGICSGVYSSSGTVKDCSFSGTVRAQSSAGGISAYITYSTVDSCEVLPGSTVTAPGGIYAGGIIGNMLDGFVTNCTVDATVSGTTYIGGIIGRMDLTGTQSNVSGNTWPTNYREIGNLPDTEVTPTPDPTDPVAPAPVTPTPGPIPAPITPTLDSDGDGLPDAWETDGVDVDGDGSADVDLPAMGADPNVPDLFIEVDYMYRPESSHTNLFGIRITDKEINLKPSDVAMKIVMEQFARSRPAFPNGINLHIDTGPDSIMDLKTGKKWGSLSRSNTLDYSENFDTGKDYENWDRLALDNFDKIRWNIFRYCIVVNKYNSTTSSGLADNLPGQCFIIADVDNWLLHDNRKTAGTFMHELGHTLGLHHGGDDDVNYKPNYLSIMNYLYQIPGLISSQTDKTNYSEYVLPEIDEKSVNEERGIDPNSVTGGKITGAKWKLATRRFIFFSGSEEKESSGNIAGAWIDFNQNSQKDTNAAIDFYLERFDENGDKISNVNTDVIPASVNDWKRLIFRGGAIGGLGISLSDDEPVLISMDASANVIEELTLDEAEELGLLYNPGDCEVSSVMPDVLYTGVNNQRVKLTVRNMFDTETTAHLQVTSDLFASVYSSDITFTSSADRTIELTVPSSALTAGKHALSYTLTCANEEVKTGTIEIEVQAVDPIVLKVGESETLTGTAVGVYAFSVEDTSIASIEGSTVHALETGRTFIILKDLDSGRTVCSLPIYVTESGKLNPEDVADDTDPTDPTDPSGTTDATTSRNGSSGGCNSGFGLAALSVIALAVFKRR